jgi:hypothetical protein
LKTIIHYINDLGVNTVTGSNVVPLGYDYKCDEGECEH